MSRFPALKAAAFPDAFLPFFLGKLFNVDGVDVHGVWIDFWVLVVSVVSLNWVRVEIGRASCRESEGKAKIEGYMSVSDEEAHQR